MEDFNGLSNCYASIRTMVCFIEIQVKRSQDADGEAKEKRTSFETTSSFHVNGGWASLKLYLSMI